MAEYRIDQATPGAGVPNVARHDLIAGEILTLTAISPAPGAGVSYLWEIVDKIGSTATLSATTGASVTIGPGGSIVQPCGFQVRLTANDNGVITVVERVFSVTTTNLGLRVPLFAETSPPEADLGSNDPDASTDNAVYVDRAGLGVADQNWRGWAEWAYRITIALDAASGGAVDTDAIHDNVAAEISAITEKVIPVAGDHLLIEDSANLNNKKRVQIGNLPSSASSQQDTYDVGAGIVQTDAGGKVEIDDTGTTVPTDGFSVRKTTTDGVAAFFRNEQVGGANTALLTSGKSAFVAPSAAQVGDVGHTFAPGRTETQGARKVTLPWAVDESFAAIGGNFNFIITDGDPDAHVTSGDPGSLAINPTSGSIYKKTSNPSSWEELGGADLPEDNEVTHATNTTVLGTTYVLVGSVYLPAGTITAADSRVMLGTDQVADTADLQIRRFTGGAVIATISATGVLQEAQPGGNITVPADDWYDLYLKADVVTTNALLRGLRFVYTLNAGTRIRQAFNQTQTGTTPLLIGSVYLPAGTLQATAKCMLGTLAGGTATIELRRFTGGAAITTWTATGALQNSVLGGSVVTPADDWYDLYLYGDAGPTVAILKGLDWTVLT